MRRFKGYMTLEASLIVPMVICVFVLLMYFTYYLYGRCVLSQDSYIMAFRISRNADAEVHLNTKKYFGSNKPEFNVEKSGKEVYVRGYSNVRNRAMGKYFLKPQAGWDYMAAGRAKDLDCIKHMRRIKRIKDIGESLIK